MKLAASLEACMAEVMTKMCSSKPHLQKNRQTATPGLAGLQETNNTYQDAYTLKDVFLPAYKKLEESPLN